MGVSPNVINCGASDWGTVLLKGKNYSGVPNAELRLNGKKVTACEPTGTLRGGSIVRAPELASAGAGTTVELAVRAARAHHTDEEVAPPPPPLVISHVMWR